MTLMTLSKARLPVTEPEKTWQQTKSEKTRSLILETTLDCFYELGYANTTTEKVARAAGISRGAMLHHFPSRIELIAATVKLLNLKRLEQFEEQELKINEGAAHTRVDEGIDAYWGQLHSYLFTVSHELQIAARTDAELREVMQSSNDELGRNWQKVVENVFPDLALSEEFETANYLTMFLLEGMAIRGVTTDRIPERMIPWLKSQLKAMFADVREVERQSAPSTHPKPSATNSDY
jgi:AcrR family transcriptional regulator